MEDANIQKLLLAAARGDNPAVRVESVDLLKNRAGSTEVRDALLNAVSQDSNPGVRLKALGTKFNTSRLDSPTANLSQLTARLWSRWGC